MSDFRGRRLAVMRAKIAALESAGDQSGLRAVG